MVSKTGYTSVNDVTGALMVSKPATKAYESGWDRIFRKRVCEHCEKPVASDVQVEYNGMVFHEWCLDEWMRNESEEMGE
jgi:hypothetical protein